MPRIFAPSPRKVCSLLAALLLASGCASSSVPQSRWAKRDGAHARASQALPLTPHGAEGDQPALDREAGRLRQPVSEVLPIAGSDLVHGRATVIVNASVARVRAAVTDYQSYQGFMPHYSASRLLSRNRSGASEVYMQWEALHGAMKMWAHFEMRPHALAEGVEQYESHFIEGNVREAFAVWRLEPNGAEHTKLTLEVFLHPRLPLPSSLLNDENIQAAIKGVTAMRKHVEQGQ